MDHVALGVSIRTSQFIFFDTAANTAFKEFCRQYNACARAARWALEKEPFKKNASNSLIFLIKIFGGPFNLLLRSKGLDFKERESVDLSTIIPRYRYCSVDVCGKSSGSVFAKVSFVFC